MGIYVEPVRSDFWQLFRVREPDGSYSYDDPLGPKNCQTHTASRLIMRANEGKRPPGISGVWPPTGEMIRRYTGDLSGGTTHSQMVDVAARRYDTVLYKHNGVDFDDFVDWIEETRGGGLSIWYRRVRDTANRRGSFTFYQNHEVFIGGVDRDRGVFTGVVDPLADGRQAGLYHGPGEYPISLFRMAAGELNIARNPADYVKLGAGLCYALLTKPTGGAPVTVPPVRPIDYGETPVNILKSGAVNALLTTPQQKVRVKQNQTVYRSPSTNDPLTRMAKTSDVVWTGTPKSGWKTIVIGTSAIGGVKRTVEAYIPSNLAPEV